MRAKVLAWFAVFATTMYAITYPGPALAQGIPEVPSPSPTSVPAKVPGESMSAKRVFEVCSPAVVTIIVVNQAGEPMGRGSGFLASKAGAIVTNLHVVAGAERAQVRFPTGRTHAVLGFTAVDRDADLVVLRAAGDESSPWLPLSSDLPAVGTRVYAIGSPQGLSNSLSDGIVSGHRQAGEGLKMLQTNAAISPGSSGGPLIDQDGHVVGITTAFLRGGQNLNLAVPAHRAIALLERQEEVRQLAELRNPSNGTPATGSLVDDQKSLEPILIAMEKKDLGTALKSLIKIPESRQGKRYWLTLARVHEGLGNLRDAFDAYTKAIEMESDSEAWVGLAIISEQLSGTLPLGAESSRYFRAAREACSIAIKLDPTNADAHNLRGVLNTNSDNQMAKGAFNTALALSPDHLGAMYNLAVLHHILGDDASSVGALNRTLKLVDAAKNYRIVCFDEPELVGKITSTSSIEVLIYLALGSASQDKGRSPDAMQCFQRVLKIEPRNATACWGMSTVYYSRSRNENDPDCLAWEQRAKEFGQPNPYDAVVWFLKIHVLRE